MTFGLHYYLINITANFPIISTSSRFRAINTHLMFHIFSAKHSAKKTAKLIMFFFCFFWHFLGDFAGLCTIVLKRNKPSDSADLFSGEKKSIIPMFLFGRTQCVNRFVFSWAQGKATSDYSA